MRESRAHAFTLIEVSIVIVIVAILAVLMIPVVSKLQARAQRMKCAVNLKNLSVAANLYLQQNGSWPQIRINAAQEPSEFAEAWIDALEPFGGGRDAWICPTIQNLLHNPDYSTPDTARLDYIPTPFDDKPATPRQWPRQPWFIERGDVHGSGNLIIFTDGSISDLQTELRAAKTQR